MEELDLRKRYSIKLLSSIVNGLINIFFVVIIPKILGPVSYGQFVYIQQFFLKLIGFVDASSSIAFFTKLSAKPERKELISFYIQFSILVFTILFFFIYVCDKLSFNFVLFPEIDVKYIYLGLMFGFLSWFSQVMIKVSDAYALTISVESVKIIYKIFTTLFLLLFVFIFDLNLKSFFVFNVVSLSFFIIYLFYFFKKNNIINYEIFIFKLIKFKLFVKEFVEYCYPLFLYSFIVLSAGLFDIWLLQSTSGSIETAYYGLSYSIAAMCFIFTGSMTPIITREFSKSFEDDDLGTMSYLFERYIPMLYSLASYFSIFLVFHSENFLYIFFDEAFIGACLVLSIIAFYPIHQTYGQLSGSIFYSTNQTKLYRNIGTISALFGVILSFLLIYFLELGAEGLAIKMVLTQIVAVNIQLIFNVKLLNLNIYKFIFHQILVVSSFSFFAYLCSITIKFTSPLISFLISGIVYTFFVILSLFIYPNLFSFSREELNQVLLKYRHKLSV